MSAHKQIPPTVIIGGLAWVAFAIGSRGVSLGVSTVEAQALAFSGVLFVLVGAWYQRQLRRAPLGGSE